MSALARIIMFNGRSFMCKVLGYRLSWIIVGRRRKVKYYPVSQIKRIQWMK